MSKELPQNERIFRDPGRLTAFQAVAPERAVRAL